MPTGIVMVIANAGDSLQSYSGGRSSGRGVNP
jgi:hypothetical protein